MAAGPSNLLALARLRFVALTVALTGLLLSGGDASGDDIEEVRARAQALTQEHADAESRLGELEQEISTVEHDAAEAERVIAQLRSKVRDLAVAQYVRPDTTYVTEDLNDLALADALARIVSHGDSDALDRYRVAQADLTAASERLDTLLAEQEQAVADLAERRDELQAELVRLEELERQRREAEERARREAEEQARREAEALEDFADAVEEAEAAATTTTAAPDGDHGDHDDGGGTTTPPPSGGGITCPVPSATFVDTWGAPRSGGRSHQGVDMMAAHGAAVYAPVTGTVEHRTVSTGGMSFFLYGDDGNTYFGTHMSGYAGGGHVAAGTLIGYVGDTGNAAGTPHLHFEIWPGGGSAVNPYPATAAACF